MNRAEAISAPAAVQLAAALQPAFGMLPAWVDVVPIDVRQLGRDGLIAHFARHGIYASNWNQRAYLAEKCLDARSPRYEPGRLGFACARQASYAKQAHCTVRTGHNYTKRFRADGYVFAVDTQGTHRWYVNWRALKLDAESYQSFTAGFSDRKPPEEAAPKAPPVASRTGKVCRSFSLNNSLTQRDEETAAERVHAPATPPPARASVDVPSAAAVEFHFPATRSAPPRPAGPPVPSGEVATQTKSAESHEAERAAVAAVAARCGAEAGSDARAIVRTLAPPPEPLLGATQAESAEVAAAVAHIAETHGTTTREGVLAVIRAERPPPELLLLAVAFLTAMPLAKLTNPVGYFRRGLRLAAEGQLERIANDLRRARSQARAAEGARAQHEREKRDREAATRAHAKARPDLAIASEDDVSAFLERLRTQNAAADEAHQMKRAAERRAWLNHESPPSSPAP